jgi:hypothetical protein
LLKYVELKTGNNDDGPAWIARVRLSKSGRTLYFNGRALKKGVRGAAGNYMDMATCEVFWVSGVKRNSRDRHWAGTGKVFIEAAAVEAYLAIVELTELDTSRFVVTHAIQETDPADFVEVENRKL